MRRYGVLFMVTIAAGLLLAALGRPSRRAVEPGRAKAAATAAAVLAVEIQDGAVSPSASAVPRGTRVSLRAVNRGSRAAHLALSGYEDRLSLTLAPGQSATVVFLADRPGDDFAWLVDGRPAGRFAVTGSHLVEGHR